VRHFGWPLWWAHRAAPMAMRAAGEETRPPAAAAPGRIDAGRREPPRADGAGQLREHFNDDAAILGAAFLGLVRRDRLVLAVADDVHLVERDLVLLVEIPLHRFGALEPDALVHLGVADVVGVALDLEEGALRIGFHLLNHL